jgi:hypothetical protein
MFSLVRPEPWVIENTVPMIFNTSHEAAHWFVFIACHLCPPMKKGGFRHPFLYSRLVFLVAMVSQAGGVHGPTLGEYSLYPGSGSVNVSVFA